MRREPFTIAGAFWLALSGLCSAILIASVPVYLSQLGQVTEVEQSIESLLGTGIRLSPTLELAVDLASMSAALCASVVSLLLGIVIYRRGPNDRMAFFVSCVLMIYAVLISSPLETLGSLVPGGLALVFRGEEVFWTLGLANLMFIFPDGRFVPHWTRWVAVALVPLNVILLFLPGLQFDLQSMSTTDAAIQMLWFVPPALIGVAAQIYRYLRVSSPAQRQQTKVVVFTLSLWNCVFTLFPAVLLFGSLRAFSGPDAQSLLLLFLFIVARVFWYIGLIVVPLGIAIAVLRYRLWDIDLIIRRTLVYGILSATLALVYFGCVVLLQQLSRSLSGQEQSEVVTVISTLAIAALFVPLRNRVQRWIEQRFYRRKYDAQQVLARFSASVRDEVNLSRLHDDLVEAVNETMQPTHVSLWLKSSEAQSAHGRFQ